MVTVSPGAKKLLGVTVGVFLLFYVVTQPQQSAGLVQDLVGALRDGADGLITFLQSLFNT